jgi:DNA (cytosine-5)-methyltransferase 1
MKRLRVLDIFSGCGGLSLGAHRAGFETCLAIDVDPILTSSYSTNFPGVKLLREDIRGLTSSVILEQAGGRIDGVVGGPPCQGFSEIGRRDADDPRRDLLHEFFRIVFMVRPRFFVMENVRGLMFENNRELLDRELSRMESRYKIFGPVVVEASEYGAATKRPRIFVIGIDQVYCDIDFMEKLSKQKKDPATVRQAIGDLKTAKRVRTDLDGLDWWRYNKQPSDASTYAKRARMGRGGRALTYFSGHRRTDHSTNTITRFGSVEPGKSDVVGKHLRLKWSGQAPTLRAGTGSDRGSYQSVRPLHPEENRVITVREAARLQGFPDWFRFHPTVWHSFRMIGNSVSPFVSNAVLTAIRHSM